MATPSLITVAEGGKVGKILLIEAKVQLSDPSN